MLNVDILPSRSTSKKNREQTSKREKALWKKKNENESRLIDFRKKKKFFLVFNRPRNMFFSMSSVNSLLDSSLWALK